MRRNRNAKIVATLGPASSSEQTIRTLFETGVDVFRLNFSHGTADEHRARCEMARRIGRDFGRPVGILADLQGPKLRVGRFAGGAVELQPGEPFRLDLNPAEGDARRVNLPHPEIFAALERDATLLLDDGRLQLKVDSFGRDHAVTRVIVGGRLSDRKGVNVPGVVLPISPLTEKDREDLRFALAMGVDWVALSFVQRPEDIEEARALIGDQAMVLSKLEKPAAIDRLDAIVQRSDAIMVARGDLGVELPPERVPILQRTIVRTCRREGKPVIVATQMLESMTTNPVPTRAEVSDVASAIFQGVDAVMLSAESASGKYPVESVAMMDRIIRSAEEMGLPPSQLSEGGEIGGFHSGPGMIHQLMTRHSGSQGRAIAEAATFAAAEVDSRLIVVFSKSGIMARHIAALRPPQRIIALTSSERTYRQLTLAWGLEPYMLEELPPDSDAILASGDRTLLRHNLADAGELVVLMTGQLVDAAISSSMKLHRVGDAAKGRPAPGD